MIVDIGGGTTDVAIISLGGIVVSESLRVAGNEFDEAIIRFVRQKENLLIGDRTAEEVKIRVGAALIDHPDDVRELSVRGRDLINGLPKTVTMNSQDVVDALAEPLQRIAEAVRRVLEHAPPELVADVIDRGIIMTGGGSLLANFDTLLRKTTGIPVVVADNAIDSVASAPAKPWKCSACCATRSFRTSFCGAKFSRSRAVAWARETFLVLLSVRNFGGRCVDRPREQFSPGGPAAGVDRLRPHGGTG